MDFNLPSRPDVLTRAGHFGLMGMQERATLLGGSFHVETAPGEGTRITVQLPPQPEETGIVGPKMGPNMMWNARYGSTGAAA